MGYQRHDENEEGGGPCLQVQGAQLGHAAGEGIRLPQGHGRVQQAAVVKGHAQRCVNKTGRQLGQDGGRQAHRVRHMQPLQLGRVGQDVAEPAADVGLGQLWSAACHAQRLHALQTRRRPADEAWVGHLQGKGRSRCSTL